MEGFIANWVANILSMFLKAVNEATTILAVDLQSKPQMWALVTNVQTIVKPICYTILSIYFLIEFLKMSMKFDMLKWEFLFKVMVKFCIAKACIDFAPYLCDAIYATVAQWITTFSASGGSDFSFYQDVATKLNTILDDMGFWKMIGFGITCIIPTLVLAICAFVVKVIAYGRLIEIYILLAVMPIPFAFILDGEGHTNTTKKFVLNFAGVCLQGFLIVIACSLYQYLMSDVITAQYNAITGSGSTSAMELLFTLVLGSVVMVVAVVKCGQWGKQLVNAM